MEADPMRGFIEERVVFHHENNSAFAGRTEIYNAYVGWAAVNGFHQMSAQRFYESFLTAAVDTSTFPVVPVTRDGFKGYRGVEIK
jgi:phage/plasmid-associated DNA primase